MKKYILSVMLVHVSVILSLGSEQIDAHVAAAAITNENDSITLPNGTVVSKKRFESIYLGLKEIFAEEAHRADDVYNIAFFKTLVIDKNRCVFGWDDARRKRLVYKALLYKLSWRNSLIIDYVHSEFAHLIDRFEHATFHHPIVQEILFDTCDEILYKPASFGYSGEIFLVDKLDQYDIMRPVKEYPAAGCIDQEALAILRTILDQKSDKHFPYLKKPEELQFYHDQQTLKKLDEIKFDNRHQAIRSHSPKGCRIEMRRAPLELRKQL